MNSSTCLSVMKCKVQLDGIRFLLKIESPVGLVELVWPEIRSFWGEIADQHLETAQQWLSALRKSVLQEEELGVEIDSNHVNVELRLCTTEGNVDVVLLNLDRLRQLIPRWNSEAEQFIKLLSN